MTRVMRSHPATRRWSLTAGAVIAAAGALIPCAVTVSARDQTVIPSQPGDPDTNGCPTGWEALRVADLRPLGYGLPDRIDSAANGGNHDGVVCGHPLTPQEQEARFPGDTVPVLFDFRDNDLPPAP